LEEQLGRAKERLAFYEGFDRLIQDNISRSAELMREAMDLRERAQLEIAQGHAEAERRILTEREKQRLVFTSLLDELAEVQQSAARVARRVTQALEEIRALPPENVLNGTADQAPSLDQAGAVTDDEGEPFILAAPAGAVSLAPAQSEPATGADARVAEERATASGAGMIAAADVEPGGVRAAPELAASGAGGAGQPASAAESQAAASPSKAEMLDAQPTEIARERVELEKEQGPQVVMVLVHGVPRAAAALSLQRHLAGLAHVDGVEAREYAEGILRLQVTAKRPLDLQDLQTWDGATGMEPVHIQSDVVEVKLPGAETF